jgi:recombinational DNA repair ATPase RecF
MRVKMINLRNHAHVEVVLCDRVNFITGDNGSGKSTVVLAILLALGADPNKIQSAAAEATKQAKAAAKAAKKGGDAAAAAADDDGIIRRGETVAEVRRGCRRCRRWTIG